MRVAQPSHLLSALTVLWLGCDHGTITALHVLPGGTNDTPDTDFFALPFPNDARPRLAPSASPEGIGGLDLGRWAQPAGEPGVYVRFLNGRITLAGPSAAVYFRFSAPLDEATIPADGAASIDPSASAYVVDVTPGSPTYGQPSPVLAAFHGDDGKFIGGNWLSLRPVPGLPLRQSTTYAALVTRRLAGAMGESVQRDSDLDRLLADAQPADEPYHSAWMQYAPLRAFIIRQGLKDEVVGATVFTTQEVTDIMPQMRAAVYAQAPAPTPNDLIFVKSHDGLCNIYSGTFQSPNFQTGDPPYIDTGGALQLDQQGLPTPVSIQSLRFAVSVPNAEMPPDGWPVILYAHGTGGDYMTFVDETDDLHAAFIDMPDGVPMRMAMISMDQVLHGPRDPTHSDPDITFFNLNNLEAARDNVKQGGADDFQLLRLAENFAVDSAPTTGQPIRFDKNRIYFLGHSQGGLTGPLFLAAEPKVKAGVLSGAGAVLILSLLNKREPTDIGSLVEGLLQEPATPDHPLLNLLQAYFESSDPNNYGPMMFRQPPNGSPPKNIFQTLGVTDNYTPDPNIAAFALSLGVQPVGPQYYAIDGLNLTNTTWGQQPVSNNVAGGQVTGVLHEYIQDPSSDGHFVIFDLWEGRHDWTRFLATHARTGVATLLP